MTARWHRIERAGVSVGLFAVCIAAVAAHEAPADGYELSIYRATPAAFWIAIGVALLVSVVLSIISEKSAIRILALLTGGLSTVLLSALPLVRGYYFFGEGDGLSHLASVKQMASGAAGLGSVLYPGIHTLSLVLSRITGLPLQQMLLTIIPIFVLVFCLFVPLCVRQLTGNRYVPSTAVLSGLLLVPLIVVYLPVLQPSPTSQAVLFVPVAVYTLFGFLDRQNSAAFGIALTLATLALLILHPQHAVVFFLFSVTVVSVRTITSLIRSLKRRSLPLHAIVRPFVAIVASAVVVAALLTWFRVKPAPLTELNRLSMALFSAQDVGRVLELLSNDPVGVVVSMVFNNIDHQLVVVPKMDTLRLLGLSAAEVYWRAFAVELVYLILAAVAISWQIYRYLATLSPDGPSLLLLATGLVPVAAVAGLYVLAGFPNQYFRYIAFGLVIVTIIGAITLVRIEAINGPWENAAKGVLLVVISLLVISSIFSMYRSPYLYQSSEHVPEAQITGFEDALLHQERGIGMAGIGSPIFRYRQVAASSGRTRVLPPGKAIATGLFDNVRSSALYSRVPYHFANRSLRERIETPIYLTVTGKDRQMHTALFGGVRYSERDFTYLESEPGISHVQSNGQFDLYLVSPVNRSG